MAIFIILLCWFIEMPLWLSIVGTVFAGLHIICGLINRVITAVKEEIETNS